jgi:uncharacterized membrane protein YedE/YeeE
VTAQIAAAFAAGLVFSVGLVLGGMTDPANVVGFLDVGGAWKPALGLVMGGAIAVHASAYALQRRWTRPLLADRWQVPTRRDLDVRLVGGAALFGVGWGLSGYCPGPALASLGTLDVGAWIFVGGMVAGMIGEAWISARRTAKDDDLRVAASGAS